MINKLQKELLTIINNKFNNYGFNIDFKYDQRVETIEQFRKNFMHNKTDYLKKFIDTDINNFLFGVFKRDAIQRDREYKVNNIKIELEHNTDKYKILKFRGAFPGIVNFTFNIITDNIEQGDLFELIYEFEFPQLNKLDIKYEFDDYYEPLNIGYNIQFSDLNVDDFENTYGRLYEFTVEVRGMFILPYTYKQNLALLEIDEKIAIEDKENNISKLIPFNKLVYDQDNDKYIIKDL